MNTYDDSLDVLDLFYHDSAQFPLLRAEDEQQLAVRIAGGEAEAWKYLVECNLRLVSHVAKKYINPLVPLEEMVQDGMFGLIRAAQKYDGRGKFSTYATWWIKQTIVRGLEEHKRLIHVPNYLIDERRVLGQISIRLETELGRPPTINELCQATGKTPKQVQNILNIDLSVLSIDRQIDEYEEYGATIAGSFIDLQIPDPAECAILSEEQYWLREAIAEARLTERERDVFCRRYGIDCEEETLEQIAKTYGISKERVRQIEEKALNEIKKKLQKYKKDIAA